MRMLSLSRKCSRPVQERIVLLTTWRRIDGKLDLFDDLRDDDYQADGKIADASEYIIDIREYDVPYQVRVMIDLG